MMQDDNFFNRYGLKPPKDSMEMNVYQKMQNISKRYGTDFKRAFQQLYKKLFGKDIEPKSIKEMVQLFANMKANLTKKYLYSLLFPERTMEARIPTKFPVPTAAFQVSDFLLITPSSQGTFLIQWTPQMMASTTSLGEIRLNTNAALTGSVIDSTAGNYVVQSTLVNPLNVSSYWQAFRVVSACMIIQYVGNFMNQSGQLGGAIDISTRLDGTADTSFSVFSNVDDRMWNQVVRSDEGLKICYFPKDYCDYSFIRPDTTQANNALPSTIRMICYGQGLPLSTQPLIRIDFIKNLEAIPAPGVSDLVNQQYITTYTEHDHAEHASKLAANSQMVISNNKEQEKVLQLMNMPGDSYERVLGDQNLVTNKENRLNVLNELVEQAKKEGDEEIPLEVLLS
jgi:hypothetical protein